MESLGERVKILEKKVSMLQGENLVKTENPYETKSNKEIIVSSHQKKENERSL